MLCTPRYYAAEIASFINPALLSLQNQLEVSLVSTVEEALTKTFDGGLAPISKL